MLMEVGMNKINIAYDELYHFYIELRNSLDDTAAHFRCSCAAIKSYLQQFHITKGRTRDKININEDELYNYYIEKQLTTEECAKKFGCSSAVIIRRLRRMGVQKHTELFTKEELYNAYIVNGHTVEECMEIFHCTRWMIESRITKYGLYKPEELIRRGGLYIEIPFDELYNYYIIQNHTKKDCVKYFGFCDTKISSQLSKYGIVKRKTYKSINKEQLYKFYIEENHSYEETAKYFKTSVSSISRACRFYGIKKDKSSIAEITRESKLRNHSYGKSKPEDDFYGYLCQKYGEEDVIRQYKDERYPFACDFYIKSLDTFVELNLFWTHGKSPFDKMNLEHIDILKEWEKRAETHLHYVQAIDTWTVRDLRKLQIARDNNLNYITYYNGDNLYDGRI